MLTPSSLKSYKKIECFPFYYDLLKKKYLLNFQNGKIIINERKYFIDKKNYDVKELEINKNEISECVLQKT